MLILLSKERLLLCVDFSQGCLADLKVVDVLTLLSEKCLLLCVDVFHGRLVGFQQGHFCRHLIHVDGDVSGRRKTGVCCSAGRNLTGIGPSSYRTS